jgi:hypothetical protein
MAMEPSKLDSGKSAPAQTESRSKTWVESPIIHANSAVITTRVPRTGVDAAPIRASLAGVGS